MTKHAFLVGVAEYDRPSVSTVHFAARDAEVVGDMLRDRCGFETTVLLNPSASEFAGSLGDLIDIIESPEDLFCFFFAGHGVAYGDESYLLLRDAYPEDRLGMYPLSALHDKFARLRSRNRLVFLDCCRNDPRDGRGRAANLMGGRLSADLDVLASRDVDRADAGHADAGRLTLLLKACAEGERAYEWEARKHGAFSWFLKKGLEGAAWRRDGTLSAHDLCEYVSGNVRAWAEEQGMRQHPDFRQDGAAGDIMLAGASVSGAGTPPPDLSECPLCGKLNPPAETFRCRQCGRERLCLRHQDARSFLCESCEGGEKRSPGCLSRLLIGLLVPALLVGALFAWRAWRTPPPPPPREPDVPKPAEPAPPQVAKPAESALPRVTEPAESARPRVAKPVESARDAVPNPADPAKRRIWRNDVGMEFVLLPAGTFQMGCSPDTEKCEYYEQPRHEVTISRPFYMGRHEVTQAQWEAVMGTNPSQFKGPNLPVENVNWHDARAFVEGLNALEGHDRYRLPTEAEWEYAARAGSTTAYCFGDDKKRLADYAWYWNSLFWPDMQPVGQKLPNAWGLYDMHGNATEWVQDVWGDYDPFPAVDPRGPDQGPGRVIRDGGRTRPASECRSASRGWREPDKLFPGEGGFRVALSLED